MNVNINLLKSTEKRYQGAVSHRFIAQVALTVGGVTCLIFVALALLHVRNIQQNLEWRKEEWAEIEPTYLEIQAMETKYKDNEKLLGELKGWGASRLEWHHLLKDLRAIVPTTIQFRRLEVRGEMVTPKDPKEGLPFRKYKMVLDGRAQGHRADEVVVRFLRTFQQAPSYRPIMDFVKLQNMVKDKTTDGTDSRSFTIEGKTIPMEMKWQKKD